ncbi:ArsR/SmtB family transcription factor [Salinibacter sp.]|uniref:ArsR/SmtB family transcription factor n=1 Tax=Salinibacter sp. TaxID=2065818 RepID=UPI0021E78CA4|nr:metalloregulator ArsR/SmtB family transcription factor [Salinibacter sp.]
MDTDLAEAFKALSNPNRLALMERLLERAVSCTDAERPEECSMDPTCCGFAELAETLDIGKATVSHHLKELRRAGLIERLQEGRRVYVRANTDRLEDLRAFLDARVHAG